VKGRSKGGEKGARGRTKRRRSEGEKGGKEWRGRREEVGRGGGRRKSEEVEERSEEGKREREGVELGKVKDSRFSDKMCEQAGQVVGDTRKSKGRVTMIPIRVY
jgi:hypothetical protein